MAILQILGGILILFFGLALAVVSSAFFSAVNLAIPVGLGIIAAGAVVILGILGLLVGWGLWTGKGWARILAIILSGLGVLISLAGLVLGSIPSVVGLAIDGLVLWYLFRPNVKAFFGGNTQPFPQPTPPS